MHMLACPICKAIFDACACAHTHYPAVYTYYGYEPPEDAYATPCGCDECPEAAEQCSECGGYFYATEPDGICGACHTRMEGDEGA